MEQTQFFIAEGKPGKLMRRYAVLCIISLLVGALYNIVEYASLELQEVSGNA